MLKRNNRARWQIGEKDSHKPTRFMLQRRMQRKKEALLIRKSNKSSILRNLRQLDINLKI